MRKAIGTTAALAALLLICGAATQGADKAQTVSGTVSRLDAAHQTLVVKTGSEEMTFVWNAETRINGVLSPDARVTVRYAPQSDGRNLAFQISVGK